MSRPSDPELRVLHGLRLKSFASAEVIASLVGLPVDDVADLLETARDKEWVRYREGALTGWMLLPAGRAEAAARLAAEIDVAGDVRPAIEAAYHQFLALNQTLLSVCTDWQLRPVAGGEPVINDHSDAAYDTNVIGALAAIDADVQPICGSLAELLDRFAGYGPRLHTALTKVQGGDVDFFTKPMIDSYHTVWFELHEDLLATLGLERSQEAAP